MEYRYIKDKEVDLYFKVGLILAKSFACQPYAHYRCETAQITNEIVECLKDSHLVILSYHDLPPGYNDTWILAFVDKNNKIQPIYLTATSRQWNNSWIL